MGFFVEFYDSDAHDNIVARTKEFDFEYQATLWANSALEHDEVIAVKAFHGPRPPRELKVHECPLLAEWKIETTPAGRVLERVGGPLSAARTLTDKLRGAAARMEAFQRDLAFGEMLVALKEAAQQQVVLNADHQAALAHLEATARRHWPVSVFGEADNDAF